MCGFKSASKAQDHRQPWHLREETHTRLVLLSLFALFVGPDVTWPVGRAAATVSLSLSLCLCLSVAQRPSAPPYIAPADNRLDFRGREFLRLGRAPLPMALSPLGDQAFELADSFGCCQHRAEVYPTRWRWRLTRPAYSPLVRGLVRAAAGDHSVVVSEKADALDVRGVAAVAVPRSCLDHARVVEQPH